MSKYVTNITNSSSCLMSIINRKNRMLKSRCGFQDATFSRSLIHISGSVCGTASSHPRRASMPRTSDLKVHRRPHSGFLGLRRFKVPSAVVYALFILVIYSHAAPMYAGNLLYDDHIWKRPVKSAARIYRAQDRADRTYEVPVRGGGSG